MSHFTSIQFVPPAAIGIGRATESNICLESNSTENCLPQEDLLPPSLPPLGFHVWNTPFTEFANIPGERVYESGVCGGHVKGTL